MTICLVLHVSFAAAFLSSVCSKSGTFGDLMSALREIHHS